MKPGKLFCILISSPGSSASSSVKPAGKGRRRKGEDCLVHLGLTPRPTQASNSLRAGHRLGHPRARQRSRPHGGRGRQCYASRVRAVSTGRELRHTLQAEEGRGQERGPRSRRRRRLSRFQVATVGPGRSGSSEVTLFWGPRRPSTSPGRVAGPPLGRDQVYSAGPSCRPLLSWGAAREGDEAACTPSAVLR